MATLRKRKYRSGNVAWFIEDTINGKRIRKAIGQCDKRTAEQIFNKYTKMNDQQKTKIDLTNTRLNTFLKSYFEYAKVMKSESTIKRERRLVKHFCTFFPKEKLSDISFTDLEKYRLDRLKLISKEGINLEFRHLKAMFNWALSRDYIDNNPFNNIKPVKTPENNLPRFFELEEIETVRSIFRNDSFNKLIEFYLLTGVRLSEALILTWNHIDFRRYQIKIPSEYTKNKKHRIINFKNDIKLTELLSNLPRRNDNKLFGKKDNGQWDPLWVSKKISTKLTKNGFPWATCHSFRHTYISHLVMNGVPLTTVKEIVGHSSYTTTLKYSHLAPGHKNDMAQKRPY